MGARYRFIWKFYLYLKTLNSKYCVTFDCVTFIYGLHLLCVACIPYRLHARPWQQMNCWCRQCESRSRGEETSRGRQSGSGQGPILFSTLHWTANTDLCGEDKSLYVMLICLSIILISLAIKHIYRSVWLMFEFFLTLLHWSCGPVRQPCLDPQSCNSSRIKT